jgi:hypothetical protein
VRREDAAPPAGQASMRMRHSRIDANTATGQFVVERDRYIDG